MAMSNNARLGLGALTAVVIALLLVLLFPKTQEPVVVIEDSAPVAEPVVAADAVAQVIPETVVIVPSLDTLRIEPDGSSVLAGMAAPMQEVAIYVDGLQVEVVTADASGSFVALPLLGYSDAPRSITLIGDPNGTPITSEETYLIGPITAPPQTVATLAEEPAVEEAEPQPAPAVIVASTEGVRVVQSGGDDAAPEVLANVALDSITYDPSGEVLIAGRAASNGFVNVYLDNQPITTSRITKDGVWRTDLPQVDTGVYTLRVDETNAEGEVLSRVETPFLREEPSVVAAQMAGQIEDLEFKVAVATVQPGATLWAIAEQTFGDGVLYVKVFEANRDAIRDPDLIYPGQVFRIPEADQ
jgi:nucleoid-associated protein YgaU